MNVIAGGMITIPSPLANAAGRECVGPGGKMKIFFTIIPSGNVARIALEA
ncbi:hypothetical protein RAA17_00850 [Komagataeibacter rhaeticus]|nr:hypothetical protein [Komagataeibacter rhaeticus]